jgi:hypothetical protein
MLWSALLSRISGSFDQQAALGAVVVVPSVREPAAAPVTVVGRRVAAGEAVGGRRGYR